MADWVIVAVGCFFAGGTARAAAQVHPLTWSTVAAAAIVAGIGWALVYTAPLSPQSSMIAHAILLLAIVVGAQLGLRQERQRLER